MVWKRGGERAPHKPLLALYAIGRALRGEPRMMSMPRSIAMFRTYWTPIFLRPYIATFWMQLELSFQSKRG
jgi:hypothetical protein